MEGFQCSIKEFPCSYLGLPLHTRQLRRVDIQPVIDKVANRLSTWKGSFINRAGRLKLVNTVLSSMPVYFLTMFDLKKWALKFFLTRSGGVFSGTGRQMLKEANAWWTGTIVRSQKIMGVSAC